jgi:hypothetical protein
MSEMWTDRKIFYWLKTLEDDLRSIDDPREEKRRHSQDNSEPTEPDDCEDDEDDPQGGEA